MLSKLARPMAFIVLSILLLAIPVAVADEDVGLEEFGGNGETAYDGTNDLDPEAGGTVERDGGDPVVEDEESNGGMFSVLFIILLTLAAIVVFFLPKTQKKK